MARPAGSVSAIACQRNPTMASASTTRALRCPGTRERSSDVSETLQQQRGGAWAPCMAMASGRTRVPTGRQPALASRPTQPMAGEAAVGLFPPGAQKQRQSRSATRRVYRSIGGIA